jgi:hypothetical protein
LLEVNPVDRATAIENDVTHTLRVALARCAAGEPDYFVKAASKMVRIDRRRIIPGVSYGGVEFDEAVAEYYHAFGLVRAEPLAVRGNHLALVRLTAAVDSHEARLLSVYECSPDGRLVRSVLFNNDDVALALQELDTAHAASMATRAD